MGLAQAPTPVISPHPSQRRPRRSARGFTLIELVAVVVIIAIVAALAIPSIASRMRDRRTRQAAQTIAQLYATARMRAMGRGAAVMVRFDGTDFRMLEAIRGPEEADPNCRPLPVSSCLRPGQWAAGAGAPNRQVAMFAPLSGGLYEGLQITLNKEDGGSAGQMDVCFTPMGGAFVDYGPGLSRLAGIPVARISRSGVGLERQVLILPNGNAQLGTAAKL